MVMKRTWSYRKTCTTKKNISFVIFGKEYTHVALNIFRTSTTI